MASESEVLAELGLTHNEAKIYLLLVKGGQQKASQLSRQSSLQRRTVYDTLQQLEAKGLAGKAEVGGVQTFTPSPPSSLLARLEEKRASVEEILPQLSKPFEAAGKTSVSVMYGIGGIKTVFEDIIALRADYCAYYGQLQFFDMLPRSLDIFNGKRVKYGLRTRYILLDVPQARERAHLMPLSDIKFMDPSAVSVGVWWTYKDRVVLFVLEKEQPATIFIKSASLARTFQKIFDRAFESGAQVYKGDEGIKAILEQTLQHREVLFIGGTGAAPSRYPEYFRGRYNPEAQKRNIVWRNIAHHSILKTPAVKQKFHDIRLLPKHFEFNPNVIWIFGDCVANVVWLPEPVAFLVKDHHIARAYRNYFQLLWKIAGKR
ncbi:Sugar-specific transcriptional regulator TrmB [uncultured archaeon]|nr:Sugar-specific transcriptional regulator TrmB [uncultured archaeon]